MTEVKPGQVWADNDTRSEGRTLRVDAIEDSKAVCTILTNSSLESSWPRQDTRGRVTRISLTRFRPTATGYRLIWDYQYGIRWPTDSVFAFSSRGEAEQALVDDGRGIGVLVVHGYEPHTSNATEWQEVED